MEEGTWRKKKAASKVAAQIVDRQFQPIINPRSYIMRASALLLIEDL
jgi:hypothetical protein